MNLSSSEELVIERFRTRARAAGGAKVGQSLRERAIRYYENETPEADLPAALSSLVDKGILSLNEAGDRYYLTESGAGLLTGGDAD